MASATIYFCGDLTVTLSYNHNDALRSTLPQHTVEEILESPYVRSSRQFAACEDASHFNSFGKGAEEEVLDLSQGKTAEAGPSTGAASDTRRVGTDTC